MRATTPLIALLSIALILGGAGATATAATDPDPWTTDKVVASDDFVRTVQQGWGSATSGGAYQLTGAPSFSVASKKGTVAIPAAATSRAANLSSVSLADGQVSTQFTVPTIPQAGGGLRVAIYERQAGSKAYRATATIAPNGDVALAIGRIDDTSGNVVALGGVAVPVSAAASARLTLQLRVTGSSPVELSARVYPTGGTVPAWSVVAKDASDKRISQAGAPGIWTYTASGSSAATVVYDKITVETLKKAATPAPAPDPDPAPAPDPDPVPAPEPAPNPAPAPAPAPGVLTAGSAAVGSTSYAVPANAVFVAASGGSDNNAGTKGAPFKTLTKALAAAPAGSTIVLRAGSYHETVVVQQAKRVTIQSYPKEAVWLDGSEPVSGFQKSGNTWVRSGWTKVFDHSPTYSRGKPDYTQKGWIFLNPDYPMAAHPDQVFIAGVAQTQVASAAKVVPGTFFFDEAARKLIIGSDPTAKEVRASTLQRAVTIRAPKTVIQGIGIRRYAPSMPDMGALRVDDVATGVTLTDVTLTEISTMGMSAVASGLTLTRVTSSANGFIGIQVTYADGMRASSVLVSDNNSENFNYTPAAGGFKVVRSRDVWVDSSIIRSNKGTGLWFDESVYDATVTNSTITGNYHHGLMFELSEKVVAANNYIANNAQAGIKLYSTGVGEIWNNTLIDNKRNIDLTQDTRVASNTSAAGHDPRRPLPDPTVSWRLRDVNIGNNVLGRAITGTDCLLCVQDNLREKTGAQLKIAVTGNLFQRSAVTSPKVMFHWPNGAAGTVNYNSLSEFARASGQKGGFEFNGAMDAAGTVAAPTLAAATALTVAVPSAVAAKARIPAAAGVLGSNHR